MALHTEAEWAWAAGLFEGEGSILSSKIGNRRKLQATLKLTDHDVLTRYQEIVGGKVYGPYRYEQADGCLRKPWWIWKSDGVDPARILRNFWPWLGERRRERAEQLGVISQLGLGFEIDSRETI